ncbi:hypothetical protein ACP8HI_25175 [Paenibacillus sp. FA6]|uniref:hypothetical protein n=1 Tax=Paenibacillus sp. FA6 TaxID=3413029 RepID=UPI003F65FA1E
MIIQCIWIAIIYGLAIAIVHGVHAATDKVGGNRRKGYGNYFIFITSNHENHVEWYVRALWLYSYFGNKEVRILVLDHASSDETVRMIRRMSEYSGLNLSVRVCAEVDGDELSKYVSQEELEGSTLIDLRIPHEAGRIPYVQG